MTYWPKDDTYLPAWTDQNYAYGMRSTSSALSQPSLYAPSLDTIQELVLTETETEMDTNVGETTTESTAHNIVQPIMQLEIPKSLRYGDYRWWMRNRTKWAMSDIEMFVCVRNSACERTLDIPLNKQNRKDERELLINLN